MWSVSIQGTDASASCPSLTAPCGSKFSADVPFRPVAPFRKDPDTACVILADQSVLGDIPMDRDQPEFGLRRPIQGNVQIARKHLPTRPIIEFDNVAFKMRYDPQASPPAFSDPQVDPRVATLFDRCGSI